MSVVKLMLQRVDEGDPTAAEELLPLVYSELRQIAAFQMAKQAPGHTLQATALVHEAYLKLVGGERSSWTDRRHFLAAATEAMRHILVDRARRRLRARHGAGNEPIPVDGLEIAAPVKEEILLELDAALAELKTLSPERAEIVHLRFFAGLEEREIASLIGISERSVQRQWSYTRAWLLERVEAGRKT